MQLQEKIYFPLVHYVKYSPFKWEIRQFSGYSGTAAQSISALNGLGHIICAYFEVLLNQNVLYFSRTKIAWWYLVHLKNDGAKTKHF